MTVAPPAGPGATLATLPGTALNLLGLFIDALEGAGITLPEDQDTNVLAYVANGPVAAVDGPCLRLFLVEIGYGMPGAPRGRGEVPPLIQFYATMAVELIRPVPTVTDGLPQAILPPFNEITTAAMQLLADAAGLALAARQVKQTYELTTPGTPLAVLPVTPLSPEGGFAGNRCNLSFTVL